MQLATRVISTALCITTMAGMTSAELPSADDVRRSTGIEAGLAIILGDTDGTLEADLAADGHMLVQTLTTDAAAFKKAREHLFAQGVYGLTSVDLADDLTRLPYYENLVNLLVADLDALGESGPGKGEIARILAMGGKAYLRTGGDWKSHTKPMPDNVAEHTHAWADSAKSNYTPDDQVGPQNALRFVGRPATMSNYYGVRVARGVALFKSSGRFPAKFPDIDKSRPDYRQIDNYYRRHTDYIVAKDAFSGVPLWRKDRGVAKPREWGTVGDRFLMYVSAPSVYDRFLKQLKGRPVRLNAVDIHTGETRWEVDVIDMDAPVAEASSRKRTAGDLVSTAALMASEGLVIHTFAGDLWARNETDGSLVWEKHFPAEHSIAWALTAESTVVVVVVDHTKADFKMKYSLNPYPFVSLIAYSLRDGKEVWRYDGNELWKGVPGFPAQPLVFLEWIIGCREGLLPIVVHQKSDEPRAPKSKEPSLLALLDVKTGRALWMRKLPLSAGHGHQPFYFDHYIRDRRIYRCMLAFGHAFDRQTGDYLPEASWPELSNPKFHSRINCNAGTSTSQYLILDAYYPWSEVDRWTTPETVTRQEERVPPHYAPRLNAQRCVAYPTPAYGSIYNEQGDCVCGPFLPAANACFARKPADEVEDSRRREDSYPGALALGVAAPQQEALDSRIAWEWDLPPGRRGLTYGGPYYHARSDGAFEVWGYRGPTTKPLVVADLEIIAHVLEHRVTATRDGKPVWNFVTGGRIASRGGPLTDGERVYFGSHDGYVYAVNLEDGSLAWRYLAAVADMRMVAFGQVESAWPVFSIVLHEGKIYCSAGRHQELEGGIRFHCIEASSGKGLWHVRYQSGMMTDQHHEPNTGMKSNSLLNGELAVIDGQLVIHPNHTIDVPERDRGKIAAAAGGPFRVWKTPIYAIDLANPRDYIENPGSVVPPRVVSDFPQELVADD
jgi:outer membrane protein assembly factor BamB